MRSTGSIDSKIESGKRDAVRPKSGVQVAQCCPVLKGPHSHESWPKARRLPCCFTGGAVCPCASAQSGRVWGRAPRLLLVLQRWIRKAWIALSPFVNYSMNGKGNSMQKKLCSECGEIAEVSLCQILSTVGREARKQQCSTSTAFCAACLQGRIKLLRRLGLRGIHKPLGEAFTSLVGGCGMKLDRSKRSAPALARDGAR